MIIRKEGKETEMPKRTDRIRLAVEAVELTIPSIRVLFATRAKRRDLCIVIVDPTIKPWEVETSGWDDPVFRRDVVLHQYDFCPLGKWERPYDAIATAKAYQAWREGQPNILTNMLCAASLRTNDTVYWGSAVYNGLVVAASGIQSHFDMMISMWVAVAYQHLAQDELQKFMKENPEKGFLVQGDA